jgi:MurNAc alpha-1-phosphate uridylyltransferase
MRAMILAAGRGERMRPLTDRCPKPLLMAGGKPLLVWHIEALVRAGITDLVINHAWLGAQLESAIGDGSRWGARVQWSAEDEALETAGGIANALTLLQTDIDPQAPFAVVNADIWTNFDRRRFHAIGTALQRQALDVWCVMVGNPAHHPQGDFWLSGNRLVADEAHALAAPPAEAPVRLTFAGLGVYRANLFSDLGRGARAPLAPRLRAAIAAGRAGAEHHHGIWVDVGTPQRLTDLDATLTGTENAMLDQPNLLDQP